MRLTTLLTLLTIFGIAFLAFYNTGTVDPTSGNFISYNQIINSSDSTQPFLLDYFAHPTDFFNSNLWLIFWVGIIGASIATALFIGALRISTTDAVTFSAWPIMVMAYGSFWVTVIFTGLANELNSYMSPGTDWALMPTILALAFVAVPAIQLLLLVQQLWRTGFVNS
jgi:hypothetical protein